MPSTVMTFQEEHRNIGTIHLKHEENACIKIHSYSCVVPEVLEHLYRVDGKEIARLRRRIITFDSDDARSTAGLSTHVLGPLLVQMVTYEVDEFGRRV